MKKYVDFFANLCQQDYQFQSYRPSHIAAASILAARRALCIKCVPWCFINAPPRQIAKMPYAGAVREGIGGFLAKNLNASNPSN